MSRAVQRRAVRLVVIGGLGVLVGLLLGLVLLQVGGDRGLRVSQTQLEDLGDAPAYTLTDQSERRVSSHDFAGKVVVANFIYTQCRDICPQLSVQMQELQKHLSEKDLLGRRVQLLSFTVDPAWDTPVVLRAYAQRHRADPDAWRFLTGPQETLIPLIVEGFHLGVNVLPPTSAPVAGANNHEHTTYEVMHSGRFVLIDPEGRIRAYYDGREFEPARIIEDISLLLE